MSTEQNKDLVRQFYEEVWTKGNVARAGEFLAADFVDHNPVAPGLSAGLEGAKQTFAMFRAAFPDARITLEDIIVEGDKVASRFTFTGTNQGSLMGMPPTGKRVTITGIDIFRIAGGKATERWGSADQLGMMQQLGVVPPPG